MKARIVDGHVAEILVAIPGFRIEDCFHPDILAQCVDAEGLRPGDPYPPAAPVEEPAPEAPAEPAAEAPAEPAPAEPAPETPAA